MLTIKTKMYQTRKIFVNVLFVMLMIMGPSISSGMQGETTTNTDIHQIKQIMGLYTFSWDEGRPEEFRSMFTDDAVFETWGPEKTKLLYRLNGLSTIIDFRKGLVEKLPADGVIRHNLSQTVFLKQTENSAKTKTVYTFSLFKSRIQAHSSFIVSGTYNDDWIKTSKGWLIKSRVIIYDNMPPAMAARYEEKK